MTVEQAEAEFMKEFCENVFDRLDQLLWGARTELCLQPKGTLPLFGVDEGPPKIKIWFGCSGSGNKQQIIKSKEYNFYIYCTITDLK